MIPFGEAYPGEDREDRATADAIFNANLCGARSAYLVGHLAGVTDLVVVIDADDPASPATASVKASPRSELIDVLGEDGDEAMVRIVDDLLTTPADMLDVLVMFEESLFPYRISRPAPLGAHLAN